MVVDPFCGIRPPTPTPLLTPPTLPAVRLLGQQETGCPLHTAYAPALLERLAAEEPELLDKVVTWQSAASFILARCVDILRKVSNEIPFCLG